jgi:aspartyl/asparaginyl beta-hydroxylase (cupin superfamily)
MKPLYGVRGVRFVVGLVALQAGMAVLAAAAVGAWAAQHHGGSPAAGRTLVVLLWLLAGAGTALLALLWTAVGETLVRLDFNRLRTAQTSIIGPLGAATLGVAAATAALSAVVPGSFAVPLATGALAVVVGLWVVATAAALQGSVRHLRRRREFLESWRAALAQLKATSTPDELARLERFIEIEAGTASDGSVPIRGYAFPGLSTAPCHERTRFAWVPELEREYETIRREVLAVFDARGSTFEPYPLVNNPRWKTLPFYKGGVRDDANCALCPQTVKLLETLVPGSTVREAMLSVLEPGGYLQPHIDNAIPLLTCHLGLVVPERCGIRVGDTRATWREGECLVIDTTFEHEAWNRSAHPRIVLLVDFWHPDLSDIERRFFTSVFEAQMALQGAQH